MSPQPSTQQSAAISAFASGQSFGLCARAGSGKTSTIAMMLRASPRPGLALAFNKKNAEELQSRCGADGFTAATLNSIGHKAFIRAQGRATLDTKKFYAILDTLNLRLSRPDTAALKQDYDLARAVGYCPHPQGRNLAPDWEPEDSEPEVLRRVLQESIRMAFSGLIDFNDQLYMPACFRTAMPKHPLVIIDEAQDLSPVQHALVAASLEPGGQIIVVGDPAQAIYAWRGASNSSYNDLLRQHNLSTLPLTVSFRCPQSVVRCAQRYVPDFEAHPSAPEGNVSYAAELALPRGGTFISRTNAPLVRQATAMLRRGQIPNYLGRDFTTGLKRILAKHPTRSAVDAWLQAEQSKTNSPAKLQRLDDRYETLCALFASGQPMAVLDSLKENPNAFGTLCTVHRSKGLEFRDVFLDLNCKWTDPQDDNIAYVGITRSQQNLTILTGDK